MSPPPRPRNGPVGRAATARPRIAAACVVACVAAIGVGCAGWGGEDPIDPTGEARTERIRALERSIEADRDALSEMVTRPRDIEQDPLHEDTALRTLAERLRAETSELERLREAEAAGAVE